jgi:predicted nucleic acid-binding protein
MRFVDTNILIYAVATDPGEAPKTHRALELLGSRDLALSVQVLQEFYVQVTRVTRRGALTHEEAVSFMTSMMRFPVQAQTVEVMNLALDIRRRFGLSYWDSAILAAARTGGCDIVLSEDLSPHQDYDGVRVVNPFL